MYLSTKTRSWMALPLWEVSGKEEVVGNQPERESLCKGIRAVNQSVSNLKAGKSFTKSDIKF